MKGTFSRLHCRISPTTAPFPTRCGHGQGLIWNRTCRHNTQSAPPTSLVHSLAVPFPYGVHRHGHDVQIPASAISQHQSRHDGCKARHRDNEWKGHCIGRCPSSKNCMSTGSSLCFLAISRQRSATCRLCFNNN